MQQFLFLSAIVFILFAANIFGQPVQDSLTFKLDQYFSALTEIKNFNGNVIVEKDGKIVLDKTYNIKDTPKEMKVNRNSKFIIASVAKLFIKFSIYKLVEQKRLNLDDKLAKFISDFPNGDKITVEQLLNHKSGLPRVLTDYEKYEFLPMEKIVELTKLEKLQFEPNTNTLYSNIGYTLLHYIINKSANEGYPNFTRNLLKKMRLSHTTEFTNVKQLENFVAGYESDGEKIIKSSQEDFKRFETGIYQSTISDMYRFSKGIVSLKNLNKSLSKQMFGESETFVHAGGITGYRAYFYKNLKTKVTFIFLANFTDIPIQEMTADIVNLIDGKPYEIPKKINRQRISLSDEILNRYIGKYSLEADYNQTFTVVKENNRLFIIDKDGEKVEMIPDSETTFFYDPKSKDGYVFQLNPQTNRYDLMIVSTGLKLKTKRL